MVRNRQTRDRFFVRNKGGKSLHTSIDPARLKVPHGLRADHREIVATHVEGQLEFTGLAVWHPKY